MLSRAYSELTTVSRFDVFYQKWEGIIKSGKSDMDSDLHFFDEHARLKLQKDDQNLKVVKHLRREIDDLRFNNKVTGLGYDDRPRLTNFRSKSSHGLHRFHQTIFDQKKGLSSLKNVI
jgi:hypothetical protein